MFVCLRKSLFVVVKLARRSPRSIMKLEQVTKPIIIEGGMSIRRLETVMGVGRNGDRQVWRHGGREIWIQ